MSHARSYCNDKGFTYLALLFAVTVIGITFAVGGQVWSTVVMREKEKELLLRGGEIRAAIGRYYEKSPGSKAYPRNLVELLKDPRYPVTSRYLRRIYEDPMTGKPDWELISAPGGGIMGVKSRSSKEPYKKKDFPKELQGFEGKSKYSEWEFIYIPAVRPKTS